jgi:hypothetical protein
MPLTVVLPDPVTLAVYGPTGVVSGLVQATSKVYVSVEPAGAALVIVRLPTARVFVTVTVTVEFGSIVTVALGLYCGAL